MRYSFLATIFFFLLIPNAVLAKTFTIFMDNDWFPYTIVKDKKNFGLHLDIVTKALKGLGYVVDIKARPWRRCLLELESGDVEAIFPASFKENRAVFAHYPADAATSRRSEWRMNQVEHVLVTRPGEDYEFDGDYRTIPQPVNIGVGAGFGDTLDEMGLNVQRNVSIRGSIGMLILNRTNSVVTNPIIAEEINSNGEFAGKLYIHEKPLRSKSYFLIFSKKGKLPKFERQRIWDAIATVRKDRKWMFHTLDRYLKWGMPGKGD